MSENDIAWAAGLFEGEGCIYFKRSSPKCIQKRLALAMTDLDIIERFASLFDWSVVETKGTVKRAWATRTGRKDKIIAALGKMLPYFGNRRAYKALNLLDELEL